MNIDNLLRQIVTRGAAVAAVAVDRLAAAVVAVAEVELPGVAATRDDVGVRLQAPGLRSRALGSRRRPPDARLRAMLSLLRNPRLPR